MAELSPVSQESPVVPNLAPSPVPAGVTPQPSDLISQGLKATESPGIDTGQSPPIESPVVAAPGNQPPAPSPEALTEALSAKDREANQLRSLVGRMAMERQVAQAQAIETQAATVDQEAVDNGEITDAQAAQRVQDRRNMAAQVAQQQQTTAAFQNMVAEGEQLGKAIAAEKFARQYNIDGKVLFDNAGLANPATMESTARLMAIEKRETALDARDGIAPGREKFDSGTPAVATSELDSMSASEKIRFALRGT
jgi:hypothetical protein